MKGSFDQSGNNYEWWAGKASPDADENWCVHCRSGDWGVTKYLQNEPSEQQAEGLAKQLTGHVENLQLQTESAI